jgi:two-component sensor histidine kinase
MADDPGLERQRVELVHVLVNYLQGKRYFRQMGRYLRSVDGKGSLVQQQRNSELLSEYYYQRENYRLSNRYAARAFELNKEILEAKEQLINNQSLRVLDRDVSGSDTTMTALDPQESFDRMKLEQDRILGLTLSLVLVLMGFVALVFAYVKSVRNSEVILEQKKYIEKSLKEKESLLKEIHHRVRNNLQMVSSLLSLQTKNTRDHAAVVALEEGKSRVKAMALIHQKLYQNDNLSSVGMQEYIESLVKSIQQVYKRADGEIEVRIDARGTELDIDQAIPIGLILNELVSNSFKHAFPHPMENPSIQIQVTRKNAQGYFEYSDNGVGLPEDSEHKSRSSMGIRLINRLVNQLQSQLNTDRSRAGVRFWFTF